MIPVRYLFIPQNMDWYSAEKFCRSKSKRLVIIANKIDQKRFSYFLQQPYSQYYWCYISAKYEKSIDYNLHCVHEKNCTPVYVAITLANNVGV